MPIVFDTDMGPDYDDVGALAVLHAFADCGYANILATVSSNKMEKTTQLICLINTYFKRPDILIGVTKDENAKNSDTWHKGAKWTEELLKKYPFDQAVASESEDAVKVYRKVLAGQDDGSVTIISVGFFTNLKNLLQSPPDEISSLPGRELVARKVNKLVSMACLFPEGREYNAASDAASINYVVENWSAPIVFSGAEIGRYIRTGDKLIEKAGNGPVKEAYAISIAQDMLELDNSRYEMGGRASYDQTAVLAAVFGDKYFNLEKGTVFISEDGSNQWEMDTNGKHTILKHKYSFQKLACIIENQMMHEPTENKHR
jgi:inosine-uridine nucleoside N-ribohydrolase